MDSPKSWIGCVSPTYLQAFAFPTAYYVNEGKYINKDKLF